MKNWLNKNYKILIILAFLIPIVIVAVVSISHVTVWYGISNPMSWAMYLSLGVEIAALSALAAISASMGRNVYFPFIIVTIIQFIGNIFFSYQYIDINSKIFKDWVDLVSPLISSLGVEQGDMIGHRRFLALFSGGLLPLISLSFLHMLVKFSEDARLNKHNVINDNDDDDDVKTQVDNKIIEEEIKKRVENGEVPNIVTASDIIGEVSKVRLSEDEFKRLEEILLKPSKSVENIDNEVNSQIRNDDIEDDVVSIETSENNVVNEIVEDDFDYINADIVDTSVVNETKLVDDVMEEESYDSSVEEENNVIQLTEDFDAYQNEPMYENLTEEELIVVLEDENQTITEEIPINETSLTEEKNLIIEPVLESVQVDDEKIEQILEEEKPIENNDNIGYEIIDNPVMGVEKKN